MLSIIVTVGLLKGAMVFDCWNVSTPEAAARSESMFQPTGFVENLLTQMLIIQINRTNKIPFRKLPSWPLQVMSISKVSIGIAVPQTPLGKCLGFTPLLPLYWPLLAMTLLRYVGLTQLVKSLLLRRKWN